MIPDISHRSRIAVFGITLISLSYTAFAQVQNYVPTSASDSFPACAVTCTALLGAQQQCLGTTDQLASENCFCQSASLQALYSSADAICAAECTSSTDRGLLQNWFRNFCSTVAQGINPLTTTAITSVAPTQSVVVVTITSTAGTPGTTITGTGSGASPASNGGSQSWIDGHWQWILMLAILLVGFGLLTWLAIWLKRRHRRKVEARRAAVSGFPSEAEKRAGARSATPDLWGPHQHMQHTQGYGFEGDTNMMGSGAIAATRDREQRRSKRESRSRQDQIVEVDERSSSARRQSTKGKSREILDLEQQPVERSRSRSQLAERSLDSLRDTDSQHQRRLREVRGSRLRK